MMENSEAINIEPTNPEPREDIVSSCFLFFGYVKKVCVLDKNCCKIFTKSSSGEKSFSTITKVFAEERFDGSGN